MSSEIKEPKFPIGTEVMRHGKRRVVIGHALELDETEVREDGSPDVQHVVTGARWVYLVHNPENRPMRRVSAEAAEEGELETVVAHCADLLGVK